MAVRVGRNAEGFSYGEIDHVHAGDTYIVRCTPKFPFRRKDAFGVWLDELLCDITWQNLTQATSGGWNDVWLEPKQGGEGRRGPLLRYFNTHI